MENLGVAGLLFAALACAACAEESGGPAAVDPFAGRWACSETRTLKFTTPAGSPDAVTMTHATVVVGSANGQVQMTATSDGGALCSFAFTSMGSSAVLASDQPRCNAGDGMNLTFTMGTADVGATGLRYDLVFDFEGTLVAADGGMPIAAEGSGTVVAACSKILPPGGGVTGGGGW